jgi:AcrR family transcriptional regulator
MSQRMNTEARREQMARAALDLLAERGSEGFNIADLAESVGLVPSAVYRHFEGREDVLDAALDVFRDRVYRLVDAARNEAENPLMALELLLTRHAKLIESGGAATFPGWRQSFGTDRFRVRSVRTSIRPPPRSCSRA